MDGWAMVPQPFGPLISCEEIGCKWTNPQWHLRTNNRPMDHHHMPRTTDNNNDVRINQTWVGTSLEAQVNSDRIDHKAQIISGTRTTGSLAFCLEEAVFWENCLITNSRMLFHLQLLQASQMFHRHSVPSSIDQILQLWPNNAHNGRRG